MIPPAEHSPQGFTHQRLLDVAAEVFAEHGFQGATIREICLRAEANVAAVNYHFGDKEGLYREVFRYTSRLALETFPPFVSGQDAVAPTERLRHFVRAFLQKVMAEDRTALHGKLMAHEMIRPTAALDGVFQEAIRPQAEHLGRLVREIAETHAGSVQWEGRPSRTVFTEQELKRCCLSIVGQILFYKHCRPIVLRINEHFGTEPDTLDALTDHITLFSIAGIRNLVHRKDPIE